MQQEEFNKWRVKLSNIIHSGTFCGICLEVDDIVWDVDASITIAELGEDHQCSLMKVLLYIFGDYVKHSMANRFICETCSDKSIQAYLFLYKSKRNFRILNSCLQDITENVEHTLQDTQLEQYEKSLICLSLETILNNQNHSEDVLTCDELVCIQCNRQFANLKGLQAHMLRHDCKESKDIQMVQHEKLTITKCPTCNFVLLNTELEEHKKLHNVKTWSCSECDETFYSTPCFETHLREVHKQSIEDLITCDFCVKSFLTLETLQAHKCKYRCTECSEIPCVHHKYLVSYRNQKESGSYLVQCIDCDYNCAKRVSMISHVNIDHLQRFHNLCNICGSAFQSKPALRQHKLKYHNEVFLCEYCNEALGSQTRLDKHRALCEARERPHTCTECDASFLHKNLLDKHRESHYEKQFRCNLCDMVFENDVELTKHKGMSHVVTISCTMCTLDFTAENEYKEHVVTHAPGTKHTCRICDATFNSKINHGKHVKWHTMSLEKKFCHTCSKHINSAYFKTHIKMHSKGASESKRRKQEYANLVRNHTCDLCGKKFVSLSVLKNHKEIHKEHVKCEICNKFVKPLALKSHMEDHVDGSQKKKVYSCYKCDYQTKFPLCLEAHDNRIHLRIRPFKCELCEKDFHARNHLSEHMKTHEGVERRKSCTVCGNHFANNQCLKKHMRIHTGEKPYSCEFCNEQFISASRRQDHVTRRHSIPDVACPVCLNLYHTARDVRAHIKKAHCHIPKGEGATFILDEIPDEHRHIFEDYRKVIKS